MPLISKPKIPSVVTLGNFDGLHLGHKKLIQIVKNEALLGNYRTVLLTFSPHPKAYFHPETHFPLFSPLQRNNRLNALEVDEIITLDFNLCVGITPESFFYQTLLTLCPQVIVVGQNFTFGHKKAGNVQLLQKLCNENNIKLLALPPELYEHQPISSTRIRAALLHGDVSSATNMLGQPYDIMARVEPGQQRGKKLGFPTANFYIKNQLLPKCGVYLTRFICDNIDYPAITAVTSTPSFEKIPPIAETHILNAPESFNLYGKCATVVFLTKLRDEFVFENAQSLVHQLQNDIRLAQQLHNIT